MNRKNISRNYWSIALFLIAIIISQFMDSKYSWVPLSVYLLVVILYFYVFKLQYKRK